MILDSSDLKYEIVDADEILDLTNQFKIQQAPTLVVVNSGNVHPLRTSLISRNT
jgi:thioredoxin-like negative regulator of GroEL